MTEINSLAGEFAQYNAELVGDIVALKASLRAASARIANLEQIVMDLGKVVLK